MRNNSVYILKTTDGDYLANVVHTGLGDILTYTKQFDQALKVDKSEADYWCRQKDFFSKIKLAG